MDDLQSAMKTVGLSDVPRFVNSQPERNPVDIYRAHLTELIAPLVGADPKVVYPALQWTQTLDKGDLVLPVPALRLKGKNPSEIATKLRDEFPDSPLVDKPTTNGTFVQFFFKPQPLGRIVLPSILRNSKSYGFGSDPGLATDDSNGRKKVIVEFSSPNIAKPFHAGHLRSTIIGGFLSNLYEAAGWEVVRMNYLGDWGKQYGLLALGFDKYGNEETLLNNPIGHLYDVYVRINVLKDEEEKLIKEKRVRIAELQAQNGDSSEAEVELQRMIDESVDEAARKYFKRMVDGDKEALGVWKRFRDLSIDKYQKTYARLNIAYDEYSGESQIKNESMDAAARLMAEKKVSESSEGAVIVDLTKYSKKLGKVLVRKKDGTSLYITRDIGAAAERWEKYHFDKMIYVVASQQDLHLAQLFKILG